MPRMSPTHKHGIRTRAIHAGEKIDPTSGAAAPNLVMSSTFVLSPDVAERGFGVSVESASDIPYLYARWGNPTARQLEEKIANLEGAEDCLTFGTGMAAATGLMLHLLQAGDHLVVSEISYVGVAEFVRNNLPRMGVQVTAVDTADLDAVRSALRPNTKLVYVETPANPVMRLTDIAGCARLAHAAGALLAVDSTFATPIATLPLALGADFVMHSLTKYLCGHGDAMGGSVAGRAKDLLALRMDSGVHLGATLSPFNAWLILRGMDTLPIRMAAHEQAALHVARFLEAHPAVKRVLYPGLPSHPQHALAKQQMQNFSGMLSFQIKGDALAMARRMARDLKVFHYAVSLGHQRSLIVFLNTAEVNKQSFQLDGAALARLQAEAGQGLFRVSIGLEDAEDLCADLASVLDAG